MLRSMNVEYVKEHRFSTERRFRFDYAILSHKIAIEYEGIYSFAGTQQKTRHTSVKGYTEDATKYNLAIVEGWRVLRYTAGNVHQLLDNLNQLLNQKPKE